MLSERLYFQDAYGQEFNARVVDRSRFDGRPGLALDRTLFYPTGGGQPNDTGVLNGVAVIDVREDGGVIWHLLAQDLADEQVSGRIEWTRRFDHMQQHTGQHILSQAFSVTGAAETVAFHLGLDVTTIDLDRAAVTAGDLAAAEALANEVVLSNRPVAARVVTRAELATLPLRRPPKVENHIRVVEISEFDWSACGGTHVRRTGEVGPIKVVRSEHRGAQTRVTFLCGKRALADYAKKQDIVQDLVNRLSTSEGDVPAAVERLSEKARASQRQLADARARLVALEAQRLWAQASIHGPYRLVAERFADYSPETVRALASELRTRPGCVALLACEISDAQGGQLFFALADGLPFDVQPLLAAAVAAGARGGGRGTWAQGGAASGVQLATAHAAAVAALQRSI